MMRPWQKRCHDYVVRECHIIQIHGPRTTLVNIWGPPIGKSWLIHRLLQDPRIRDCLVVNHDMEEEEEAGEEDDTLDRRLTSLIHRTRVESEENKMILLVSQKPLRSPYYSPFMIYFTQNKEDVS